jgi:hypothetical protein
LPIGLHSLLSSDISREKHHNLLQETAEFIGIVAKYLSWSQYRGLIKKLLKYTERGEEVDGTNKDRIIFTALCCVVNNFHFDLRIDASRDQYITSDDADNSDIGEHLSTTENIFEKFDADGMITTNDTGVDTKSIPKTDGMITTNDTGVDNKSIPKKPDSLCEVVEVKVNTLVSIVVLN